MENFFRASHMRKVNTKFGVKYVITGKNGRDEFINVKEAEAAKSAMPTEEIPIGDALLFTKVFYPAINKSGWRFSGYLKKGVPTLLNTYWNPEDTPFLEQ